MNLGFKLAGVVLFFTLTTSSVLYVIVLRNQNNSFREMARAQVKYLQGTFEQVQRRDVQMLAAVLEVIVRDVRLQEAFLRRDREGLYDTALPLYRNLQERYRITHFYFIDPDGRVFLRVHNRALHGDLVRRRSFLNARRTSQPAWEMEPGKTAFALRAVMPYTSGGRVIGYVELGEEIDHFLTILKQETASEFAIIGSKNYLDRNEWRGMRRVTDQRDNWDDLKDHVVIGSTSTDAVATRCFGELNLDLAAQNETIFQQDQSGDRTFVCGGFALRDVGGRPIGALLTLVDLTGQAVLAQKANRSILQLAVILFLVTFLGGILLSRRFTGPIARLTAAVQNAAQGDLKQRVPPPGRDEIGTLTQAFNTLIDRRRQAEDALMRSHEDLEQLVAERTAALREANERLHDLSAHLQSVREDERTRIAREIHDELGQSLTAINMELSLLRRGLADDQRQNVERAESLNTLVESTVRSVKRISQDLRPGILDHLGLSAAIEWQAEEFEKRTGISCTVTSEPGEIVLDQERSTAVFRIFQEAMTNVARHAATKVVHVLLQKGDQGLILQVRDEGRGMDEQDTLKRSFGIIGMRERVQPWRGSIGIESVRGKGTTITVHIPLDGNGVSS